MCFSRKSKSSPAPTPPPVPIPIPEPIPEPPPIPDPVPVPPDRSLPTPYPRPLPPVLPPLRPTQYIVGNVPDIGEAINAALATPDIDIIVTTSGELLTPVVLQPGARVRLAQGVVITTRTSEIPFRLMEGTSIIGEPGSVIIESSVVGQFTVIAGFYGSQENGRADADITLQGFEVRGSPERQDFYSAPQAVSLGNCKKFQVSGLWINGTHSIGIQAGGGGVYGNAAEDGTVSHCRFTRVASQSLALVNGRRIIFEFNDFEAPGQVGGPGSHPIDLELNGSDDVLFDIAVRNNWIDFREASVNGNGIIVQVTTGSQEIGQIVVEGNVILGGSPYPPVTNWCSNGIAAFGATLRDVTVRNNKVWRTGQSGMYLQGSRIIATDNELVDIGGGGTPGVVLSGLRDSEFSRNTTRYTGDGPYDNRIVLEDSEVKLEGNTGFR